MLFLRQVSCRRLRTLARSKGFVHGVRGMCSAFGTCLSIRPSRDHPSITCFDVRCNLSEILGVCSNNLNVLTNSCLGRTSSDGMSLYTMKLLCHCNCFSRTLTVSKRRRIRCSPRGFKRLPVRGIVRPSKQRLMVRIPCTSDFAIRTGM